MSQLQKRVPLHSAKFRREHPAAKAFHAPQRDHPTPVQMPKPKCGVCGGKVGAKDRGPTYWLCEPCNTGSSADEMARAA